MNMTDPRIAYFDQLAQDWDQVEPSCEQMSAGLGRHAGLLGLQAGQSLLEVGCGTGKTTAWLARAVAPGRVTGVDFAPEMIARARTKGLDADFDCADVCSDLLPAATWDVVLCFHSFPHFRDQSAALRNLARSLRPGGRLIVMHLAGSDHINEFHARLEGAVNGDVLPLGEQWQGLLAAAGLKAACLIDRHDLFFLDARPV